MSLGDKLSRLRKENNYTQEQLADILGVTRQAISKWESDVAYPETDKLIRLSALYRCSIDYLVKDDVSTPEPIQTQGSEMSVKANKLFSGILRFAPLVLYAIWALLLWAFYVAPLFKISDNNLYQWFGNTVVGELQPNLNALVSLGVISGAYIAVLGVLQRFADKKANLIANVFSFVLQAGVFVAAMCLIGVCKSLGLEVGKIVVVVATLTGVFALLQAVFMALGHYFSNDEPTDLQPRKTHEGFRKFFNFVTLHKALAIVIVCVLILGIVTGTVLPIVLSRTVNNPFDTDKVSQIKIGDSRDDVIKILGEPLDIDTSKLAKVIGDDGAEAISKKNMYYYCSKNAARFIKKTLRILDKAEDVSSSRNTDDAQVLYAQLNKMLEEVEDLEFQYIEVYFKNGRVSGVEYDSDFSMERESDVKWDYRDNSEQKVKLIPDKIPYGQTPHTTGLYAQTFYADGSYKLSKLEYFTAVGDARNGWTISWSDHWGNYTDTIFATYDGQDTPNYGDDTYDRYGVVIGDVVEEGSLDNGISFVVAKANANGKLGYALTFSGEGELGIGEHNPPWENYAQDLLAVKIGEGITSVSRFTSARMTNLITVTLPQSLKEIGHNAFFYCANLKSITVPEGVTTIGLAAFWGCASLREVNLPSTLTTLGESVFWGCTSLQQITLPTGLVSIGADAFNGCKSLETINIPSTVTYVGYRAFLNCTSLQNVIMSNFKWRVVWGINDDDYGTAIYVGDNAVTFFTDIYCEYHWYCMEE